MVSTFTRSSSKIQKPCSGIAGSRTCSGTIPITVPLRAMSSTIRSNRPTMTLLGQIRAYRTGSPRTMSNVFSGSSRIRARSIRARTPASTSSGAPCRGHHTAQDPPGIVGVCNSPGTTEVSTARSWRVRLSISPKTACLARVPSELTTPVRIVGFQCPAHSEQFGNGTWSATGSRPCLQVLHRSGLPAQFQLGHFRRMPAQRLSQCPARQPGRYPDLPQARPKRGTGHLIVGHCTLVAT